MLPRKGALTLPKKGAFYLHITDVCLFIKMYRIINSLAIMLVIIYLISKYKRT